MQIKGKLSIKRRETKNISFLVSKRELIRLGEKKRERKGEKKKKKKKKNKKRPRKGKEV